MGEAGWTACFRPHPGGCKIHAGFGCQPGLYNGFLAAGLLWGLSLGDDGTSVRVFFLSCILIAGLYGAATASRKILLVQAVPAAAGLLLLLLASNF